MQFRQQEKRVQIKWIVPATLSVELSKHSARPPGIPALESCSQLVTSVKLRCDFAQRPPDLSQVFEQKGRWLAAIREDSWSFPADRARSCVVRCNKYDVISIWLWTLSTIRVGQKCS